MVHLALLLQNYFFPLNTSKASLFLGATNISCFDPGLILVAGQRHRCLTDPFGIATPATLKLLPLFPRTPLILLVSETIPPPPAATPKSALYANRSPSTILVEMASLTLSPPTPLVPAATTPFGTFPDGDRGILSTKLEDPAQQQLKLISTSLSNCVPKLTSHPLEDLYPRPGLVTRVRLQALPTLQPQSEQNDPEVQLQTLAPLIILQSFPTPKLLIIPCRGPKNFLLDMCYVVEIFLKPF